ncbi:MAG: TolC family protein [Bacteroidota bacterium]
MRVLCTTLLLLVSFQWATSQELEEFINITLEKNDITARLPPLDSLIQRAYKRSAELRRNRADQQYFKGLHRLAQTRWIDYFYLEATYSYGVFDNLTAQQLSGTPQASQTLFSTEQSRYTFGPSVKIPLSAIFNRSNDIKAARSEYKRSVEEAGIYKERLRDEVIRRYSEVIKTHRLLLVYGTTVDTYKVQSLRAEADYLNGIIEVAEYTRLQQMFNEAMVALEAHKSDLALAILLLESITGVQIEV